MSEELNGGVSRKRNITRVAWEESCRVDQIGSDTVDTSPSVTKYVKLSRAVSGFGMTKSCEIESDLYSN